MKKLISVIAVLVCVLVLPVQVFAVGSPTKDTFVNAGGTSDIDQNGIEFTEGSGITIVNVGHNYSGKKDLNGTISNHSVNEGKDFAELVKKDAGTNLATDEQVVDIAVVDIHFYGVDATIPQGGFSFTIKADVEEGDKVLVHHYVDNKAEPVTDFTVDYGEKEITVKNVTSLSLWSITKIKKTTSGGTTSTPAVNPVGPSYTVPRTDVK